jgi:hypothetical protein
MVLYKERANGGNRVILDIGEKVHIIERRFFKEDIRRHFIGEIVKCSENSIRVKGYVWTFEPMRGFNRKPEIRESVINLDEGLTINIIPKEVNIEEIKYVSSLQKGHIATDGKSFSLDVTEFASG